VEFGVLRFAKASIAPAVGIGLVVITWELIVLLAEPRPDILPSPWRVLVMGWRFRSDLWVNLMPTLAETLVGLAATVAAATAMAIAADFFPRLRRVLYPVLVISQTIPIIVIAPLMVIWFGYGMFSKIVIIILVTFFAITVALSDGFDATEPEATNLLRSMGATRWQEFIMVRLPGAMPHFFTGLRIAITWSVTAAIFGEYVGAEKGLGIFMQIAKNDFRTDLVLAAVILSSLVSLVLFGASYVIQLLCIPWYTLMQNRKS
jgi:ABC-type nitrate/sulfonate/bicarbonate transport system permease component